MNRMMTIGVMAALMFAGGCKPGNSVPDMPEPVEVVQPIVIPTELDATPHAEEWSNTAEYFNSTVAGLNRVAANVQQLGDKATAELKSGLSEVETQFRDIRGRIESARQSGALGTVRDEIAAASAKLDTLRTMLVQ